MGCSSAWLRKGNSVCILEGRNFAIMNWLNLSGSGENMDVSPKKSEEGKCQRVSVNLCPLVRQSPPAPGEEPESPVSGQQHLVRVQDEERPVAHSRRVPGRLQRTCHGRATGTGQSGWRAARAQVPLPLQTMTPPHTPSGDWGETGSVLRPHTYQG